MGKVKIITGKILYGLLFTAVLPLLLILWAKYTSDVINLPVLPVTYPGYILLAAGIILVISGILHLWLLGKGLPMNAFPPEKLVTKGIFSLTKHPIYTGAVLITIGLSVVTRSSSGLWLVSPLFILMIAAYVTGFENERTLAIFGEHHYKTFLSLPADDDSSPSLTEKIAAFILISIPWLIVYESFIFAGVPNDAVATNLQFEKNLPVWEFTEVFYLFTYSFAVLVPLVIKRKNELRRFIIDIWFAIIITGLIYFSFPFIVNQREFIPGSFLGKLILFERSIDGVTCALPSFHVIWGFVGAVYFSAAMKRLTWLWYTIAILIALSCLMTGNHSIPDIIAGFIVFLAVLYRVSIWNFIRQQAEKLANSWREWRIGPVRIINHGFYGGAAGFAGTLIAGWFLGPKYAVTGFLIMIFVVIGAGLWAQLIEGSPKLLRPYGYYGGLTGGILACIPASMIFSVSFYILIASFAMAAPWIQALGRLRCLVQGCCHGKPSNEKIGIHFTHPLSRVNKISGLNGVALHPTQLYSIGCNIVTGLVLLRLYSLGMPAVFIIGIYLILNGLGRFVEEAMRGEAQTPYWAGMRIYQWIAIVNIILGAVCTTIPDSVTLTFQFNVISIFLAVVNGIFVMIASGVDFPESNRRFARLTSN